LSYTKYYYPTLRGGKIVDRDQSKIPIDIYSLHALFPGLLHITIPTVAPPLPSAALILGTGIIDLIGLKRRSVRKA
jgi:hypothetical protein